MSNLHFADPPRNAFYERNADNSDILSDEATLLIEEKTKQFIETEIKRLLQPIELRHTQLDQHFQDVLKELSDLRKQIKLYPEKDPKLDDDLDDDGPDEDKDKDDDDEDDDQDEEDDDEDEKGDEDDKENDNDREDADDDSDEDLNKDGPAKGFSSELKKSPWVGRGKKHL